MACGTGGLAKSQNRKEIIQGFRGVKKYFNGLLTQFIGINIPVLFETIFSLFNGFEADY